MEAQELNPFFSLITALSGGMWISVKVFFLTLLFSLPGGLLIAFGRMSKIKVISVPVNIFMLIIRGTPLMLQIIFVYFAPAHISQWLGHRFHFDSFVAVIIAFAVNYAAYFAEIYRGGIQSVPVGQEEAGLVLGMTKSQIFFKVKLLQMVKRIVPPVSNEIITLVKDTSLSRIIALQEVIWAGQAFMKGSQGISGAIWPLFFTAVYYLIFSGILTVLLGKLERKLDYFR